MVLHADQWPRIEAVEQLPLVSGANLDIRRAANRQLAAAVRRDGGPGLCEACMSLSRKILMAVMQRWGKYLDPRPRGRGKMAEPLPTFPFNFGFRSS
jgi:hypothetical protein